MVRFDGHILEVSNMKAVLFSILLMLFGTCSADIMYQCVDESGHKYFDNKLKKGSKCTAMDLGPAEPEKLTKKQREQKESEAREVVRLQQESGQAQADSAVECRGEKACKKMFALTQVFISEHSSMKLQIATDTVIETHNPTERGLIGLKAIKTPGGGDSEKIRLLVSCKAPTIDTSCLRKSIDIYKQFRPFIEGSSL